MHISVPAPVCAVHPRTNKRSDVIEREWGHIYLSPFSTSFALTSWAVDVGRFLFRYKLAVERLERALEKAATRNADAQAVIKRQETEMAQSHIRRGLELIDRRNPAPQQVAVYVAQYTAAGKLDAKRDLLMFFLECFAWECAFKKSTLSKACQKHGLFCQTSTFLCWTVDFVSRFTNISKWN